MAGPAWIRYAASWRGYRFDSTRPPAPATLTLQALPGQSGISANSVARVEVQLGQAAPVVLTAPNSTDATGRPQYLFDLGQPAEAAACTLQVRIGVTDATGFAYTKQIVPCVHKDVDFGAFSDYGSTSAQLSYEASAPITALASRTSPTGYADQLASTSQASFSGSFPSADGDMLMLVTNPSLPLPTGTRVKARIEGGGGAFAESNSVQNAAGSSSLLLPFVTMDCCGPRPASDSSVDVQLYVRAEVHNIAYPPDATFTYRFSITDPATGAAIGGQADTIIGDASFPLQVKRGQVIEMEVTPNDPRISVSASARLGTTGGYGTQVSSNVVGTPARFKVFCCSR
ncbi:hypothetical protein [Ramlibacter sp.]|uniref:hypothetical protein n=1 Tax=Ramlibacter sp. TaxID=1917967 RepID=UPI002CFE07C5|nr:hypothetical protein [Ramlibacter sp.]HWI80727.1 hypothetical protein [Ramlibacter sp.]